MTPSFAPGSRSGFGLDRLAMILTGVPDVRMLVENDVRLLAQFR